MQILIRVQFKNTLAHIKCIHSKQSFNRCVHVYIYRYMCLCRFRSIFYPCVFLILLIWLIKCLEFILNLWLKQVVAQETKHSSLISHTEWSWQQARGIQDSCLLCVCVCLSHFLLHCEAFKDTKDMNHIMFCGLI